MRRISEISKDLHAPSAAIALAAFLGLLAVALPPSYVLGLVLILAYATSLVNWPWVSFVATQIILFASPDVKMADAATVVAMVSLIIRLVLEKKTREVDFKYIRLLLYIFYASVLISLVVAIFFFRNQNNFIYRDARIFLYWLWIPLLYSLCKDEAKYRGKMSFSISVVAGFVVIATILQASLGQQFIASGRVGALDTEGYNQASAIRVQMPGFQFVMLALVSTIFATLNRRMSVFWGGLIVIPLFAAIYLNFGRALWFWTGVSMLLIFPFLTAKRAVAYAALGVLITTAAVIGLAAAKPVVAENFVTRLLSVREEGGARSSYGWRKLENEQGLSALLKSPIVGVAIGGEYRPWMRELSLFEDHTRYLHNGYLFMALKIGVIGAASLLLALMISWLRSLSKITRNIAANSSYRLAAAATFIPSLLLSITQPEIMTPHGVVFYAVVATLLLVEGNQVKS